MNGSTMAGTYKSRGIVFKCLKYSENSVIVDLYTLDKGMRSYIISGLSSKKNRAKSICFQHLNILNVVAYDKPDGQLARIKEQSIAYHYTRLHIDVVRSSIGLFALEVSRNSIKEFEQNKALYDYIESFFVYLDTCDSGTGLLAIKYMLDLTVHLGIVPMGNWSTVKPYFDLYEGQYKAQAGKYTISSESSRMIYKIHTVAVVDLSEISTNKKERDLLLDHMLMYYRLHIEHFQELKSIDVLRTIF